MPAPERSPVSEEALFRGPPRIAKGTEQISSLEDWRVIGHPAGKDKHWVDGRSAKEEARAWIGLLPVLALLDSHETTRGLELGAIEPEVRLKLDDYQGNTRNTDVLVLGTSGGRRVVVGVEAKADEAFDSRSIRAAASDPKLSARSKLPARVNELCARMFGVPLAELGDTEGDLPYQLLFAPIAVLLEAERHEAEVAVFVVHEFVTDMTTDRDRAANEDAWTGFMDHVAGGRSPNGRLAEIEVPDNRGGPILLAGKAVSDLREESASDRSGCGAVD